ncbi:MAG: S8 family serine peptidase [Bacteroidales bacterium]|nr:S8 family serine peptidase [Bacteroidales bacterium]
MRLANSSIIIAMALMALSCAREPFAVEESSSSESKAVNTFCAEAEGQFLVRVSDPDAIPESLNAERLFPSVKGKESIEKKYGLDQWFAVSVPEGMDINQLTEVLESESSIISYEFPDLLVRPYTKDNFKIAPSPSLSRIEPTTMNDPLFRNQWFLYNSGDKDLFGSTNVEGTDVNIRDAWTLTAGDPSVVVAVVDEGVKTTHPDLAANMWTNAKEIPGNGIDDDNNGYIDDVHGYNFAAKGAISWGLPGDEGHGTHVAGLVAAVNNNGIGVSSVAGGSGKGDGVRIMSCQIFSGSTRNDNVSVARAIKYAADNGASVLQCSFGLGTYYSDKAFAESLSAVKAAYDYFRDPANANCSAVDGNIVVISAGNSHNSKAEYPGAYRDYICVSAISQDNLPAWYTNYGDGVNIASPGGDNTLGLTMLSTVVSESDSAHSDYGFMHGTSMATPVVSGIAALGLSYAKKIGRHFSRDEFEAILLSSVNSLEPGLTGSKKTPSGTMDLARFKGKMGTGVIDAWKVLMNIEGVPFVTVKTGESVSVDLSEWFGSDASYLTMTGVEISDAAKSTLGITDNPTVSSGKLTIKCTKAGSAKITIGAIAGGNTAGSDSVMGGKTFSRTVSIVSRPNAGKSNGWL